MDHFVHICSQFPTENMISRTKTLKQYQFKLEKKKKVRFVKEFLTTAFILSSVCYPEAETTDMINHVCDVFITLE